ncbi:MAG: hypothetical protein ACXAC5_16835 [Promethearchaeota archaeon]|jgi:hypothetical protein
MSLEFRCGAWEVYKALLDRYRDILEKLWFDHSLTEEQREQYKRLNKNISEQLDQQAHELMKAFRNGSLTILDCIPEEFSCCKSLMF